MTLAILGGFSGFSTVSYPYFNSSYEGWNKTLNSPNFVSFEVKPKEIVYIGDLSLFFIKQKYWVRGSIKVGVSDNYEDALDFLSQEHPELIGKTTNKRLAKIGILPDKMVGTFW